MKIQLRVIPLYLVFAAELLQHTLYRERFGTHVNPVLLLLEALFIALYPLLIKEDENDEAGKKKDWLFFSLIIVCSAVSFRFIHQLIIQSPINIERSDIIPLIDEVYLGRLFNGEYVYDDYPGFGYGTGTPNYLTMHWLPFAVSKLFHFDHRYTMLVIILGVFAWYGCKAYKRATSIADALLKVVLPHIFLWCYVASNGTDLVQTVELLILSYYLLLSVSLFTNSAFLQAIGIAFPLLSRYALIFWLPFYAVHEWMKNRKVLVLVILYTLVLVAGLYVVPFMLKDPMIFVKGTKLLDAATLGEWDGQSWQQPGDKPYQLYQHLGFASWFYEFYPGTLKQKMIACKNTMFMATILAGLLPLLFIRRLRERASAGMLNIVALKFTLTFFYAFVTIPYVYLSLVPVGISMVIVSRFNLLKKA